MKGRYEREQGRKEDKEPICISYVFGLKNNEVMLIRSLCLLKKKIVSYPRAFSYVASTCQCLRGTVCVVK